MRKLLLLLTISLVVIGGCTSSDGSTNPNTTSDSVGQSSDSVELSWRTVNMTDVTTNQTFTVESLPKPVLIESFAIWCPPCTRQQQEIKALKENRSVTSVSVNVDPEEDGDRVRNHASSNDFDWRYVTAPKNVTDLFINEFGRTFISPPTVPVILVCDDNSSELLSRGVSTASELEDTIDEACRDT